MKYCDNPFFWQRRITREVKVGHVGVGGDNPIRVQTMLISDTMNTDACVNEAIPIIEAGCEILRITAPSINDAKNLKNIVAALRQRGFNTPIVADIHFVPAAALEAAEWVEKVRVNPGNYADRKKFAVREYSDDQYTDELERLEKAFTPLVLKCKQLGRAMRIGTNHGSLSDRIMNRYGDTPLGMVESALEFVRVCRKHDYHAINLSMKASNPKVMIEAYRLLVARMNEEGPDWNYPIASRRHRSRGRRRRPHQVRHRHRRAAGGWHRRHRARFAHRGQRPRDSGVPGNGQEVQCAVGTAKRRQAASAPV